ncbi:contactin-2 [Bradysia coprophila]|uniref:contactin-2 n=1 Tax=Bradysia coprophila TaxID=38358 RepID=UPI00187D8581|nr:contactin-2 [Bradysia coprophila]
MSICGTISSYSLNLLLFTQVLSVITLTVKYNEYIIDMGKNATIPCTNEKSTIWIKENQMEHRQFHAGSDLRLTNVTTQDAGTYTCLISTSSPDASALLNDSAEIYQNLDDTYVEAMKVNVVVRTVPGPVSRLSLRISTILGVLMWEFKKNMSGGYPLKSFTAEFRQTVPINEPLHEWERLDPINIAPNVRYMEVYHLTPNTTYEFRIWGNNLLGAGEIVNTFITTLPEIGDEELIRILLRDVKEFDKNVWTYAVSVVMGAMVILGLSVCFMLLRDCYEEDERSGEKFLNFISNILVPKIDYKTPIRTFNAI